MIETTINGNSPGAHISSGFATTNWSAKYFGAIWLPLAQGNLPMEVLYNAGTSAVRVWICKTQFGSQAR